MTRASSDTVVLVEGASDRLALLTLAERLGLELAAARVDIVVMNGITNTRAFAQLHGPQGAGSRLAGLYDASEEGLLRRGLEAAGITLSARTLADSGFHACVNDLEDELIRALGVNGVEAIIEEAGELASLELLAQMPVQRTCSREAVLKRFFSSQSGRKAAYAERLTAAVPLAQAPPPLLRLLESL